MAQLDERFVDHGDGTVRYLVGGTGPALVLCHGFLGSAENFETWFGELAQHRTLVIPDLPGCGASTPLTRTHHTGQSMAGAVEAVCTAEGIASFDLAGLCLGVSVAMAVLHRRPSAVRTLVLHTPLLAPGLVRDRFHRQVRVFMAPGVFTGISWLSRQRIVSDLYKRLLVEGDNVDIDAAEVNFANQLRADPRATREWLLHGLSRDDLWLLRAAHRPTLVIVATDDRIVDVPALRRALAGVDHVELVEVEEAGHGWTEQYVRRQLEVITRFLGVAGSPSSAAPAPALPA